jgi:hypothetical protein
MLVAAAFAGWARVSATVRTLPAAAVDSVCAECDGVRSAETVSAAAPAVTTAIAEFLDFRCVRGRACLAMADPISPIALPAPPVRRVRRVDGGTL